jgi:hypothetical protein
VTKKEIRAEITKLRKLLKSKPRGKPKGGQYERDVAAVIVHAFRKRGIITDDCHRTPRGSKEGDLKCGSALSKMFPFCIECKWYASVPSLHLLRKVEDMNKSWPWHKWWKQLKEEVKLTKKPGVLIFRENNGIDLISIYRHDVSQWRLDKVPKFVTFDNKMEVWTMDLKKFLKVIARSV